MDSLTQYRDSIKERLDNADLLVAKLVHENTVLTQTVETKTQEIEGFQQQIHGLEEKVRELTSLQAKQEENMEIVKDLFEHLCGVRVHKSYEDDTGLWFDTSQGSKNGIMDYKLGFVKSESFPGTEVIYVPLLKQRTSDELRILQNQIPAYMFDTLSFPLKALHQFYSKMARCLNKKVNENN
ncbi:hypothetical protein HG535_0F00330 [Zygotorulaspora mrakii]|uniref:Monopolin complex subunit Csm1/Pcs1 C-terminal domain-containing protein n=1 Tax=Zygotorulaspora mrakii TaxID=42260 RepID=A0A7H9B4X9_ZYGMR|nr:uncharacterized protein HG535_0F00330 [Zygotorulaspora mrakii]QLG73523.1 hypothetical protein HG535_0F00330 [Zygotorulaspora mrakii]